MTDPANNTPASAERRPPAKRRPVTVDRLLLLAILGMQILVFVNQRQDPRVSAEPRLSPSFSSGVAHKESAADSPRSEGVASGGFPLLHGPGDVTAVRDHVGAMLERAMAEFELMDEFINFDEGWGSLIGSPAMDMRDGPDDYAVVFSLPHAYASDIRVSLDGRLLTVTCGSDRLTPHASRQGSFVRSVWLPGPVGDPQQAYAVMTNGVLKVRVPKGESLQASRHGLRLF